ncbi:MAG: glycosyl hydrolase [Verrucomicrobiota bacterium]
MNIRTILAPTLLLVLANFAHGDIATALPEPAGGVRSDTYPGAGFGFYVPTTGTTINRVGFWDQGGDGLLAAHTVALYGYNGSSYVSLNSVTIPAGTAGELSRGYRWVTIPDLVLPNNGQGADYYLLMASQGSDPWTNGLGAVAMDSQFGTLAHRALIADNSTLASPNFVIDPNQSAANAGYGGPNLGFFTAPTGIPVDTGTFLNPGTAYRPRPLWFWNNTTVTPTGMADQLTHFGQDDGWGGVNILPFGGGFSPQYLSEDYFTLYGAAAAKSRELGLTMCIYDEYGFPSGSAGGSNGDGISRFANAFPDDTIKRLDKTESTFTGPGNYTGTIPAGNLMACVAMNTVTLERIDLTPAPSATTVSWNAPAGTWKIMFFTCVKDGDTNVDYLSPESCDKYTAFVHQKYYDHLSSYFGPDKTIDGLFFDEITIYRAQGRMWTPAFNQRFQEKFGSNPALLYPSLWYDIGADTAYARNQMFGMRAELYATGYPKRVQDWARAHGNLFLTGHQDQEEIVNPSNISGDLMKCFKYQDIPGIDKIGGGQATEKFYKVVSSSASNWDKSRVMSETYGAMGNISISTIYDIAMDQYTKGINDIVPHAAWYNPGNVTFLPELSYRNPLYASALPGFTKFMSRLNLMLQGGRHVADIGVLYPIATLQGGNSLDGPLGYYAGGVAIPEADYADVGSLLSDNICRDFTFLHPEVIDEKCSVDGALFNLANAVNYEQYRTIVLPGQKTISWSNLQKIQQFYNNGGKVIATRLLPSKSAEPGHDADVVSAITSMFPVSSAFPVASASTNWASGNFDAYMANDSQTGTRWNAADGAATNQWLEIDFGTPKTVNKTITRESFGRINSYQIQWWNGSGWMTCSTGTTMGVAKTDNFTAVTATKIRLFINSVTSDSPSISEFEVYNAANENVASGGHPITNSNGAGGKTYFLPIATPANLREALDDAVDVFDLEIENSASVQNIHKVKDGRHVWYLANRGGGAVDTFVRLRGNFAPQLWDPVTGDGIVATYTRIVENGHPVTRVKLTLAAGKSIFIVAARENPVKPSVEIAVSSVTPLPPANPSDPPNPGGGEGNVEVAFNIHLSNLTSDSRYLVEKSTDLVNWQIFRDFSAATAPGTAIVNSSINASSRDSRVFFRIRLPE